MFEEKLYTDHVQKLSMSSVLHEGRTQYQSVLIFENETFGRVLALDDVVQLTQHDNHIYHEMIAHVPLLAHEGPKDVLIIGGGDGGTLREVLKHPIKSATLIELDAEIIALSQKYFPEVSGGAFEDSRVSVQVLDGASYLAETSKKFDVIVVDSTDPVGPGEVLFSQDFYRNCRSALRDGGIIAVQSGVPFYRPAQLKRYTQTLREVFGKAAPFLAPVPTYAHGSLALIVAGDVMTFCPSLRNLQERADKLCASTRYYSPNVHRAAFAMAPMFEGPSRACSAWDLHRDQLERNDRAQGGIGACPQTRGGEKCLL